MQGDWKVTKAEVRTMIKRLNLSLTTTDVEEALRVSSSTLNPKP